MHPVRSVRLTALLRSVLILSSAAAASEVDVLSEPEKSFLDSTRAVMSTMMHDMEIVPHGNVDLDFIGQMVPHHRGAIDMARAELRYGKNERLRRIAQEILVEQGAEIAVMQREGVLIGADSERKGVH